VTLAALTAACGSRTALGDDYGLDANTPSVVPTPPATTAPIDGGSDANESGTVVACATCVVQQCGNNVATCVRDAACRATMQCAGIQCIAKNNLAPACLVACADGGVASALPLLEAIQCVTGACGAGCNSLLGSALGGGRPMQTPKPSIAK
jgi:hypothetical protein